MHPSALVKRRAQALRGIQQSAAALAEKFPVTPQAEALARARAKDAQVDTLLKLEALDQLLYAIAYQANPEAFAPIDGEAPVETEISGAEDAPETEAEAEAEDTEEKPKGRGKGRGK